MHSLLFTTYVFICMCVYDFLSNLRILFLTVDVSADVKVCFSQKNIIASKVRGGHGV